MKYLINIKNKSHKVSYDMTLGPYTRKHDAIKGLATVTLPNLKAARIVIIAAEGDDPVYCEVVTKMTSKTLSTSRFNYRTLKEEGESTYKFDY